MIYSPCPQFPSTLRKHMLLLCTRQGVPPVLSILLACVGIVLIGNVEKVRKSHLAHIRAFVYLVDSIKLSLRCPWSHLAKYETPVKAALRSLGQSMFQEYAPKGIHVAHVVIDGVIESPNTKPWGEKVMLQDAKGLSLQLDFV